MLDLKEYKPKNSSNLEKNGKKDDKKSPKKFQELDFEQKLILADLLDMKAATPLRFEVECSPVIKGDIRTNLEELAKDGLVEEYHYDDNDPEKIVYTPSLKTRWWRVLGRV